MSKSQNVSDCKVLRTADTHLGNWGINTGSPSMLFADFILQARFDWGTGLNWGEGSPRVRCGGGESEGGVTFGGGGGSVTS